MAPLDVPNRRKGASRGRSRLPYLPQLKWRARYAAAAAIGGSAST